MAPLQRRGFGPEVSRIVYVKSLPYSTTGHDLYRIFGKFGIRQVRLGNSEKTKGTAYIVFNTMQDAKRAVDALSGFNMEGRFLTLVYFHARKKLSAELEQTRAEVEQLRQRLGRT